MSEDSNEKVETVGTVETTIQKEQIDPAELERQRTLDLLDLGLPPERVAECVRGGVSPGEAAVLELKRIREHGRQAVRDIADQEQELDPPKATAPASEDSPLNIVNFAKQYGV